MAHGLVCLLSLPVGRADSLFMQLRQVWGLWEIGVQWVQLPSYIVCSPAEDGKGGEVSPVLSSDWALCDQGADIHRSREHCDALLAPIFPSLEAGEPCWVQSPVRMWRAARVKRPPFVSECVYRIHGPRHAFTAVCTGVGYPERVWVALNLCTTCVFFHKLV